TPANIVEVFRQLPNVLLVDPALERRPVLSKIRILLAPSSRGHETFNTVIRAMAHGIPVLAGDEGDLPDAKQGIKYVLPTPKKFNRNNGGVALRPEVVRPWETALLNLIQD